MKPFDYIVVLVAILIGLAIADLILSLHRLLRAGRRVSWHWAAPSCAVLAALAVLRHFWAFWVNFHDLKSVTLLEFLPVIGLFMLLFLASAAALPDEVPAEGLDLKAFYLGNKTYFWGLSTAWLTALVVYNSLYLVFVLRHPLSPYVMAIDLASVATTVSLVFVRRLWWHAAATGLLLAGAAATWLVLRIG